MLKSYRQQMASTARVVLYSNTRILKKKTSNGTASNRLFDINNSKNLFTYGYKCPIFRDTTGDINKYMAEILQLRNWIEDARRIKSHRYCKENRLSRVSCKCKESEGLRKYTSHRGNWYEVSYQIAVTCRFPGRIYLI